MPITDVETENMDDILADIHGRLYNWFTCHLLRLIAKADFENRTKLKQVYPEEVRAYEKWYISGFKSRLKEDVDI